MGHGVKLTERPWNELDRVRFTTPSADVFRNCLIILMSDSRETITAIAGHLRCSPETVRRIRKLYRMGGVDPLQPIKPPGRPTRATPAFLAKMKQAVQTNPMTLGYGFSTWSASRLAAHLGKVTGIRFSDDQMRRRLRQHGFSFHRPQHTLQGQRDEKAYEKARKQLLRLKKKP